MPKSKANSITPSATQQPKKACLVLKTYDPASGTCIKYRTDKAAEVGRLIAALGTCGRVMAALPEKEEKEEEEKEVEERVGAGVADAKGKAEATEVQGGRGGDHKEGKGKAGGGGKKKKGKRWCASGLVLS